MTRHDDTVRMHHMLDSAREALTLVQGKARSDVDSDRVLSLALVRLLEIIGEAAGRVSNKTQNAFSTIPWAEIVGLRNRLIHGYDSVDMDILWQILDQDLAPLVTELEKALEPA